MVYSLSVALGNMVSVEKGKRAVASPAVVNPREAHSRGGSRARLCAGASGSPVSQNPMALCQPASMTWLSQYRPNVWSVTWWHHNLITFTDHNKVLKLGMAGIKPRSIAWEASALTTARPILLNTRGRWISSHHCHRSVAIVLILFPQNYVSIVIMFIIIYYSYIVLWILTSTTLFPLFCIIPWILMTTSAAVEELVFSIGWSFHLLPLEMESHGKLIES